MDKSEEAGVRSEDPQGSMTRFGEGVVLVETFAAQYKVSHLIAQENSLMPQLPLPALLQEARTSLLWSELSIEEKGMMNGWVRALVSPAMRLHAKTLTPSSDLTVSMMKRYCTCHLSL